MGYRVLCRLARLLLHLFYRRIEVMGLDRVPATGPVIVAANHQNALRFLTNRDLHRQLLSRRRGLAAELRALGALVPASALAGWKDGGR